MGASAKVVPVTSDQLAPDPGGALRQPSRHVVVPPPPGAPPLPPGAVQPMQHYYSPLTHTHFYMPVMPAIPPAAAATAAPPLPPAAAAAHTAPGQAAPLAHAQVPHLQPSAPAAASQQGDFVPPRPTIIRGGGSNLNPHAMASTGAIPEPQARRPPLRGAQQQHHGGARRRHSQGALDAGKVMLQVAESGELLLQSPQGSPGLRSGSKLPGGLASPAASPAQAGARGGR